jgi:hypothetical protein
MPDLLTPPGVQSVGDRITPIVFAFIFFFRSGQREVISACGQNPRARWKGTFVARSVSNTRRLGDILSRAVFRFCRAHRDYKHGLEKHVGGDKIPSFAVST